MLGGKEVNTLQVSVHNIQHVGWKSVLGVGLMCMVVGLSTASWAASAREIDASVDTILEQFQKDVSGASTLLETAKGVLTFPRILKAGFVFGGEYGEGAIRIGGKSVDYYNLVAASFGFQFGAQAKTVIMAFMEEGALAKFRNASGWEVGVDASVAIIAIGAGASVDTTKLNEPIVAFVFDQKGLMYNLSLEGSKITKLDKK